MGKIALITGASLGMGKSTAIIIQGLGSKVYGVARRLDQLQELKDNGRP